MKNERRIIDDKVQRLIGLAQGLVSGSVNMTEGELLGERIGIGRAQLPPEQIEFVYTQICELCESRNYATGRFATEVLVLLIGTQPLTSEQVGHLLHLLHNFTGIDTAESSASWASLHHVTSWTVPAWSGLLMPWG